MIISWSSIEQQAPSKAIDFGRRDTILDQAGPLKDRTPRSDSAPRYFHSEQAVWSLFPEELISGRRIEREERSSRCKQILSFK